MRGLGRDGAVHGLLRRVHFAGGGVRVGEPVVPAVEEDGGLRVVFRGLHTGRGVVFVVGGVVGIGLLR